MRRLPHFPLPRSLYFEWDPVFLLAPADLLERVDLVGVGFFTLFFDAVADALAVVVGLTAATVISAGVASRFDDGFATIVFDGAFDEPPRITSDWPGKMSARRSPFARINAAVVVWYFLAMPPSVSPERTTWSADPRDDE